MKIGRDRLYPFHTSLVEFGGSSTDSLRWIKLPLTLGVKPHQITLWKDFIVVDCPSPYNAILGRLSLEKNQSHHFYLSFNDEVPHFNKDKRGEGQPKDDAEMEALRDEVEEITLVDHREKNNIKPLEEVAIVFIHLDYPGCHVMIGTTLNEDMRNALVEFLKKNYNVIEEEVAKLIKASIIKESRYPGWLANVVIIPKKGSKWRVCVDFTDLNKAYLIDSFSLPKIDLIVDVTSKHELLSFMDAFSGYHQISMHLADVEKPSFIMERWLYYYKILSKNKTFEWIVESEVVFHQLKEYLGSPPLLTVPNMGEEFTSYLSISPTAAHPIVILKDQPLKQIFQRPDTLGRLLRWSIELSEFDINYQPRLAIKVQALADFIAEFTHDVALQPELTLPKVEPMKNKTRMKASPSRNYSGHPTNTDVEQDLFSRLLQGDYLANDLRMVAYLDEVKAMSMKINLRVQDLPNPPRGEQER
ncbi:hypothetical protein Acr_00g0078010 [Actinidia rufa]|uniref:Reverse transcriptase domain-containing protein n=1 Tax=Actinidia rufa TaxID=165716 RepID=A0A7J0DTF0_9ERIC|nr:hypothetical protein Acr_00g0078010 [Actinidia rufa]